MSRGKQKALRARRRCDIETAQKIARALGACVAYRYAETDQLAELIDAFCNLSGKAQEALPSEVRRKVDFGVLGVTRLGGIVVPPLNAWIN